MEDCPLLESVVALFGLALMVENDVLQLILFYALHISVLHLRLVHLHFYKIIINLHSHIYFFFEDMHENITKKKRSLTGVYTFWLYSLIISIDSMEDIKMQQANIRTAVENGSLIIELYYNMLLFEGRLTNTNMNLTKVETSLK
jgi:hypothetical protein